MKRYNIFYQVHKGLRAQLYETALHLQQADFDNPDDVRKITAEISQVMALFEKHAHSEDDFILKALSEYEPSVTSLFTEEHAKDHELGKELGRLLDKLSSEMTADEKEETGASLNRAFRDFLVFNLNHMAKEETVLNSLLWRYFTDEELHAITMKIISQISPEKLMWFNKWMIRGLSNNEISGWFCAVRNTAPRFIFDSMMELAEKELPAERFAAVACTLCEGAMVA